MRIFIPFLTIAVFACAFQNSWAQRFHYTAMLSSTASQRQNVYGRKPVYSTALVQLTNVASVPQTVTVAIEQESLSLGIFYNAGNSAPVGWTFNGVVGGGWSGLFLSGLNRPSGATSASVREIELAPFEKKSVEFYIACPVKDSLNFSECHFDSSQDLSDLRPLSIQGPILTSPNDCTNFECGVSVTHQFRFSFKVDQNRGAVMAHRSSRLS